MINVKIDFNADAFMKQIAEAAGEDIKQKLRRGGVEGVTVLLKKSGKNISYVLEGPEEEIEKATKVLGG